MLFDFIFNNNKTMWRIIWKTLFCRYLFNTNSTFTTITYHNMQHLSVTTERNVPIPKWLCNSLRVSSVYIVDFSILQHWAEDYVNICGLHSMFRTVLLCQHHCTAVSPSFSCFSPAQFTKNSPVGRCQTQLRTPRLPPIYPRHCNSVVPSTVVFSW